MPFIFLQANIQNKNIWCKNNVKNMSVEICFFQIILCWWGKSKFWKSHRTCLFHVFLYKIKVWDYDIIRHFHSTFSLKQNIGLLKFTSPKADAQSAKNLFHSTSPPKLPILTRSSNCSLGNAKSNHFSSTILNGTCFFGPS